VSLKKRAPGRLHRLLRLVLLIISGAALIWTAGLVAFSLSIPTKPSDRVSKTDAIVVLTGGSERIAEGLALLRAGLGKKLLVTGVAGGLSLADALDVSAEDLEDVACCVELGHTAADTAGNAQEAAHWMMREGFTSLRLVTGSYHMPRSLLEFERVMPEARIIANPVFPGHVKVEQWWRFRGTAGLIASEFAKYLGVTLRAYLPSSRPRPTPS
jgi:uncharacterized SAM-binding protein YcdF (DUF218 family)